MLINTTWHMQLALIWRPNRNARRCIKGERRERARNNAVPAVNAPRRHGSIELRSAARDCRLPRNRGDFEGQRPLSRARRAFNHRWSTPHPRSSRIQYRWKITGEIDKKKSYKHLFMDREVSGIINKEWIKVINYFADERQIPSALLAD